MAANTGDDVTFTSTLNSFVSQGYNLIGTGNGVSNFIQPGDQVGVINPMLGPLADNGGFTLPDGSHILTHALLAGSPAINAGDLNAQAGVGDVPLYDERGEPFGRVYGGRIDIGAFEYQQPSDLNLVVDTLVDESDGDYSRGDLSLREAIELANMYPGPNYPTIVNTIHFDPALTANGSATILLTQGELQITHSVTIVGPGANLLTIDASGNDPTPDTIDFKGSRIFEIDDGSSSSYLDVSVRDLSLVGGDVNGYGGAILNHENLTVSGVNILSNSATTGSGIAHYDAHLRVLDSDVSQNLSASAAIFAKNGDVVIERSSISDNIDTVGIGVVVADGGNVAISYSTLSGNTGGSAVNAFDGSLRIDHSRVTRNTAGIVAGDCVVSISDTAVSNNIVGTGRSELGSGGIVVRGGTLAVERSIVSGNVPQTGMYGGGIDASKAEVSITDTLVAANSSQDGSGIRVVGGNTTILRSSVLNNTLEPHNPVPSGAIRSIGSVLEIRESTISGNKGRKQLWHCCKRLRNGRREDCGLDHFGKLFRRVAYDGKRNGYDYQLRCGEQHLFWGVCRIIQPWSRRNRRFGHFWESRRKGWRDLCFYGFNIIDNHLRE